MESGSERFFVAKYGDPSETGWGPRLRLRFGYFTPADRYEMLLDRLVTATTKWLDVGAGRFLFHSNRRLSRELAGRCRLLVGLDPDPTLEEHEFLHEKIRSGLEEYRDERQFDLVTLRMVVEHVPDPEPFVAALARLTQLSGKVVVYTVNKWSPGALIAKVTPFGLHHAAKRILWRTEEKDTFPVAYKLNTRSALRRAFEKQGFRETAWSYLDDCGTTSRFWILQVGELILRTLLHRVGLRYPENCILAVFERVDRADP